MKIANPPQFDPNALQMRALEAQGKVQARALEVLKKQQDGTIGDDPGMRDMMETHQKWMRSETLQQFNPMNMLRGGMTKDQLTLQNLSMRGQMGDADALVQMQYNFPALQALALGERLGVSFEQVKVYLENAAAQAMLNGDHGTMANYTQALAGLDAAAHLIPAYEQAARSIPSHKKEKGTGPLPQNTKENVRSTSAAVRTGLDGAKKSNPLGAEVAALLLPGGQLKGPSWAGVEGQVVDLHFDQKKIKLSSDGMVAMDLGEGLKQLDKADALGILRGIEAWRKDPKAGSWSDMDAIVDKALAVLDPKPDVKVDAAPDAKPNAKPTAPQKKKNDDEPPPLNPASLQAGLRARAKS